MRIINLWMLEKLFQKSLWVKNVGLGNIRRLRNFHFFTIHRVLFIVGPTMGSAWVPQRGSHGSHSGVHPMVPTWWCSSDILMTLANHHVYILNILLFYYALYFKYFISIVIQNFPINSPSKTHLEITKTSFSFLLLYPKIFLTPF